MANPTLLDMPIAVDGDKNTIPTTTSPTTGLLSQQYGWRDINSMPVTQGGKAPNRKDFNGVLNLLSNLLFYCQKGWQFEWDSSQAYYAGCVVKDTDGGLYCANTDISVSSTHPKDDAVNWSRYNSYALRSYSYNVGDTSSLPNILAGYFLECTTAGTTGATAPVITPPVSMGDIITDGTAIWTVRKCYTPTGDFGGLNHNGIYRGKNLGTFTSVAEIEAFLSDHKVSTGEFEDLFLGDYFTIQDGTYNKEWEIAGFDHYLHRGDTDFTTHHIVLIPKTILTTSYMNSSNTTSGGYAGSYMHTTVIPTVNTNLTAILGSHLLTRRELLTTSVNTSLVSTAGGGKTGATTSWAWSDVKSVLPNEVEIYGCTALSSSFYDVGVGCEKLPIFNFKGPAHTRETYWLRAVVASTDFCRVYYGGFANSYDASSLSGVRPLICIG